MRKSPWSAGTKSGHLSESTVICGISRLIRECVFHPEGISMPKKETSSRASKMAGKELAGGDLTAKEQAGVNASPTSEDETPKKEKKKAEKKKAEKKKKKKKK
jgi:hypothetical protein